MTIGVGIVGLSASGGWASYAHLPALRAVEGLELRALATSSAESARAASEAYGVPGAFHHPADLAAQSDIDLVVVSVKVPRHRELVLPALAADVSVFSEWPLGTSAAEAAELSDGAAGTHSFVGLQGSAAPAVRYLRDLVADGYVGDVVTTSLVATSGPWGGPVDDRTAYLMDRANGATLLTIVFGHLVDSVAHVLGEPVDIAATTATRRPVARHTGTGADVPVSAEDQIVVGATLSGGAVASLHLRGANPHSIPLLWEISGTEGDLRVAGAGASLSGPLTIEGARGSDEMTTLAVPEKYDRYPGLAGTPAHAVAHAYDRIRDDLVTGSRTAPDFAHAQRRHRLLEAVQQSAEGVDRLRVG